MSKLRWKVKDNFGVIVWKIWKKIFFFYY
jgi:hypothetical protein